jgi:hypothetical protein
MIQDTQDYLRSTGFIWADKAAILAGCLFSALLLVFWSLVFLVVGGLGGGHLWRNFGIVAVERTILIVGLAWFVMRVAHFLAGGPAERLKDWLRECRCQVGKPLSNWRRSEQH